MALFQIPWPEIPACAWQRPLGRGWEQPAAAMAGSTDTGPWQGMPLGGLGAGCIGRSPRGDFNRWHLDSREPIARGLPACQFAIFEQPEGGTAQAHALCTESPNDGSLGRWQWYPPERGTYAALYPRSWFHYAGVFATELICEQFSPVWAHSYQESSYPIAAFEWTVRNPTDRPIVLSILLSWQNVVGWFANARSGAAGDRTYQSKWGDSTGNFNQWIVDRHRVGVLFNRVRLYDELHPGEGQMAIASVSNLAVENFYLSRWDPSGDGSEVWDWFARDGSLPDKEDETPAAPGEQIAAAMAVRFTLRPGRTRKIPFYLAWDFPVMEFAPGVTNFRRHSDFFARTGNNAWTMVRTALKHSDVWREKIEAWQAPIVQRPDWPDWFKQALCNELYLLVDGGTLWTAATEIAPVGQFAMLSDRDAPRYEPLAERLYGSFALLLLWPRLDRAVLEAFARAIQQAHKPLSELVPADLGSAREQPWEQVNLAAAARHEAEFDPGSAFIVQVNRNFLLTDARDADFLWECWPAIAALLAAMPAQPTRRHWHATVAALSIAQSLLEDDWPTSDPAGQSAEAAAELEAVITRGRDWLRAAAGQIAPVEMTDPERDRYAYALEQTAAAAAPLATAVESVADQYRRAAELARQQQVDAAWQLAAAATPPIYERGWQFRSPATFAADGQFARSHALAALSIWVLYGALTDANRAHPDSVG